MTEATIDKLIFALGGDVSALNAAYAQAEAGAQKTGTTIQANLGKGFKDAAAGAAQSATALKKAMGDVNTAVASTHGSVSMATREFRALFDELSSGRTRMTPGTLAIIATRVFGISGATLAWGAALAAIPGALALAAYQSESAMGRVENSLKRTGNAAGATLSQVLALAQAGIPGLSERGGIDAMGILMGGGNLSMQQAAAAAAVVPGFAGATGTTQDKASAALEKLFADPAKGAQELNNQFKLLDVATTRQIDDLAASGKTQEAQDLLIQAAQDRFAKLNTSSFSLSNTFEAFEKKLSNFWFNTGTALTGTTTDQARLATMQQELASAQAYKNSGGQSGSSQFVSERLADLPGQIAALQAKIAADGADAMADAANAAANKAGFAAQAITDKDSPQAQRVKELTEQLGTLNDAISRARTTGTNTSLIPGWVAAAAATQTALQNQKMPDQAAAEAANDARRIAAAPASQRNLLRDQIAAQRTYEKNLSDPSTAPYAQAILGQQLSTAALNNKDLDKSAAQAKTLKQIQDEADAEEKLAAAYDKGYESTARTKALGEAKTAADDGKIAAAATNAYADALERKAIATADVAVAEKLLKGGASVTAAQGEAAVAGDPAALQAVKEQAAALAVIQPALDAGATMDSERLHYAQALAQEQEKDAAARATQLAQENKSLSDNIDMTKLQLSLQYADADVRAKAIADLQTEQELISKGYQKGTPEYNAAYSSASYLKEQQAAVDAISGSKSVQVLDEFRTGLSDTLLAGVQGFTSLSNAAINFGWQLADLITKLYVLQPLMNALMGTSGGASGPGPAGMGGLLGSGLAALGLGGNAVSGGVTSGGQIVSYNTDAGEPGSQGLFSSIGNFIASAFAKGGAWSGGVRYAASGMVLGGPTLFNAPGGPVIGGELGKDSEALMPLARGPSGALGVKAQINRSGGAKNVAPTIIQQISVHPDVSAVARSQVLQMMPQISAAAIAGYSAAVARGFQAGVGSG